MSQNFNSPVLSVVIPVYNEEAAIEKILRDWSHELSSIDVSYSLILINDGSTDNSLRRINNWIEKNPTVRVTLISQINQGHGTSVINGYRIALESKTSWIFQCDSDDQIEAKDFSKLWKFKSEADFIIGERLQRQDPLIRLIMSRAMRIWVFLLFRLNIADPNCPFRLCKAQVLQEAMEKFPDTVFAPNIHLSIEFFKNASQGNLKSMTVPINHRERQNGSPSLKGILKLMEVCFRVVRELFMHRRMT